MIYKKLYKSACQWLEHTQIKHEGENDNLFIAMYTIFLRSNEMCPKLFRVNFYLLKCGPRNYGANWQVSDYGAVSAAEIS